MAGFFIHNGKFHQENEPVISADNKSFRFGDGLFETIRLYQLRAPLWDLHMSRLFGGLHTLKFNITEHFSPNYLLTLVLTLAEKNNLSDGRVRITVYRKNEDQPGFVIQIWPAQGPPILNIEGWHIGIFQGARKSPDQFAALKSNSYLPYTQAAIAANENSWQDALVLNTHGRIADSSIANIFWVKNQKIFTPPLSEGPIAGVMRQFLLANSLIHELPLTIEHLMDADEVFLTNAFRGIQWVSIVESRKLGDPFSAKRLFKDLITPLFS